MEIPKKIKDAIINNQLVVFVGAGLSVKFNLPNWTTLVEDVIKEIDTADYNAFLPILRSQLMTPIDVLEILKPNHNIITKYVKSNFKVKNGDFITHKNILKLSGQIVTTNFDNAFEEASDNLIIPTVYTSNFNLSEINKSDETYIFKLHGSYTEPDHCILFKDQYANLYSKNTAAKEKLKSIFSEKVILFIGFSFNDPDINIIFNGLDSAFGNNNSHFILTKDSTPFDNYKFLQSLIISDYNEIDSFIAQCLAFKEEKALNKPMLLSKSDEIFLPRIALLYPNPIDINLSEDISNVVNCFDNIDANFFVGTLNLKTLQVIEDFDLLIIVSKVYKTNLYIEDDNLKSNLLSPEEICHNVPNDIVPIVIITNEKIEPVLSRALINIWSFKNSVINKFIFKALKKGDLDFAEKEILVYQKKWLAHKFQTGQARTSSIYGNDKILEIGKKCLTNVVGRIEEQSIIALKLIGIRKSNKLLNIKASGGTGKTTIIKKVAYELYNRGYYRSGVKFKSCETVKSLADFEEILISGFNLTNILDFKSYLIENYSHHKIDALVILDNFETVVNVLNENDFIKVIELLKFSTDFANIVITSREKLSLFDDVEDVYSLTPLITDDALILFEKNYGVTADETEIKVLRQDILEDLLNNNPLAIKLVTKSRTRFDKISQLKAQLKENFFESINEDYSLVFKNNADLNIERTKSIYQSINYSYTTLTNKEKIALEILSLFPDGISLSNFKKCFIKNKSSNSISDSELRVIRDKSLVEDYNGVLQLQPIIRRFAEYQFLKRPKELKRKYCLDAYMFNCFILEIIEFIEKKRSTSEALRMYNLYKNNLLNVLSYIPDIELSEKGLIPEKKFLLNFIYSVEDFVISEKQISEFHNKLQQVESYFSDLPNARTLIKVLDYNKTYYHNEFDISYKKLSQILSVHDMENRVFKDEDYIESRYKSIIAHIHGMEGYTIQMIKANIRNNNRTSDFLDAFFFYLGITNNISRRKNSFYFFEYELMFNRLDVPQIEHYISTLYSEEHLEIMQSTYTLSKVKKMDTKAIKKLVVTNPYTKGLQELMFAFNSVDSSDKIRYFESALSNLTHIKYYYLEALYYYCLFLKENNLVDYIIKHEEGLALSREFYFQYMNFLFSNIDAPSKVVYEFSYLYYPLDTMEEYVNKHNLKWEKEFKENEIDK